MNIGIVNYGMGNLASVYRALETLGSAPFIAERPDELERAFRIILPGVGAFAEGMDRLAAGGWIEALRRRVVDGGTPLLGICLGMQFLADRGVEGGAREGLGLIPGDIAHLSELGCTDRVPHAGWNELHLVREDALVDAIPDGTDFYFVHSYAFRVADPRHLLGTTPYGCEVAAAVRKDNVWGTQFHPEKSSKAGLRLLRNFVDRS